MLNGWISKSFGGKPNPSEVKQVPPKRRGSHDIPVYTEEGKIFVKQDAEDLANNQRGAIVKKSELAAPIPADGRPPLSSNSPTDRNR